MTAAARIFSPWLPVALAAGVVAGAALQLQQSTLLTPGWRAGLAGAGALAGVLCALGLKRQWLCTAAIALAALLLAWAATDQRAAQRLADALDPALEGQDLVVTGVVASLPRMSAVGQRFEFEVESATLHGRPVRLPPLLALGWFHGFDGEALVPQPPLVIAAGDRWRLPLRLKRAHGAMNPHGFDLELWLFERGVLATGSVRPGAQPLGRAGGVFGAPVQRLRQHVRDAIMLRVADPGAAGVLAALAVGDQAAIERADWDVFRATGVAHLMSISGLHVTMFGWLAAAIVGALWRRSERACLWLPAPAAARIGALVGAAAYALLAGWGVPAQRTVLMIAVVVGLKLAGWRWPSPWVLCAAAGVVTLVDPWALMQPGFWLSFGAVALLMAGADEVRPAVGWRQHARAALRTQVVATVGLAPLTLLFFQQVSLVGFAANLVAIPVVTLLITPLALLGMLVPPMWPLAAAAVLALQGLLQALAMVPMWSVAAAPAWAAACGLLGGALLVMPLPWRLRALGLPLLLPLLWPAVARPAVGQFELLAADVGQGTAVLVRTRDKLLLYDSGAAWSADSDAGARVLLPLLRARGEVRIDRLILSHRDSDHVGGAASLLAGIEVTDTLSSLGADHPLQPRLPGHRRCDAGQRWHWDGVDFEILHPLEGDHALPLKPNALSCVLKVTDAAGRSVLLTGDIEAAQEAALVGRDSAALRSEVLLLPHHGSRTSSTHAFLAAVQPQVAVAQAAYRSRFGHPAPEVLARLKTRGITIVRSDECGAWAWPQQTCQRERVRRYWHHPPGVGRADR